MASASIDFLIGKIVTILENETSSVVSVRFQVDEIKLELLSMKSFLEDAEGKQEDKRGEKTWIANVRDLAYDVEDIIDEFMYHMYQQKSGVRFAKWLHQTIHIPKNLWFRHQIANRLEKITKTIKEIPERNQRYGIGLIEGTSTSHDIHKWVQNQAESSLFVKEDELVGIEGKKKILMGWLMNGEQNQAVVSVVGMGGSGKTTLVAKTFTNEIVKRHFDCYAWITVSQAYVIEDLFRNLIEDFHKAREEEVLVNLNTMSYRELLEILVNYLESKSYLVVLDDVWDIKLWREISIVLPDRQLGSRIMLTTRIEDIASCYFGVESHVHRIQPLTKKDSWELFGKKAFSTCPNKCCPSELEPLACELVEKCEGLPLAVVALSGLMFSKKSLDQWSKVSNSLTWHLSNNILLEPVKSILLLSFNDLPYQLKHCFLYCSIFPEDYLILNKKLVRLWMAEGFVEHIKGFTPEEVGDRYVMELIFRSMLQERYQGQLPACKMHDLMRELALSIAEKEKFCAVYDGSDEMIEEIGVRRLSIQITEGEIKLCRGMSKLRSLLIFATGVLSFSLSKTPLEFKLLRVLDLEDVSIDKLPDELVYLFNLRYLNLRGTQMKELPKSIGRLCNLQSLDLRWTLIEALPRGIANLLNLRHLLMSRYKPDSQSPVFRHLTGIKAPTNIIKLKKLQILSSIESDENIIRLVRNMTQLVSIGITNVKGRDEMGLCVSLEKMNLLRYLQLRVTNEGEFLRVDSLSSPPPLLERLVLAGKLEKVPRWLCSLHNLTYLYLRWSTLEEDMLPHIAALPNLSWLNLVNAYNGEELCFSRGFQKLAHLELFYFPVLNKITIEKGVMPNLRSFGLDRCPELKRLPQGFECLTLLEEFSFKFASKQFVESIQEGGLDHSKLQQLFPRFFGCISPRVR